MSNDVRQRLSSLTECTICADTYIDPRILPCVHTYCFECIKGISQGKSPGDRVACPLCRKEFILPDNGVRGLPKNFFIEQLKDVADSSPQSDVVDESSKLCEGCCDDTPGATMRRKSKMYCMECQQRLCEACSEVHRRLRASRGHTLVEISDDENVEVSHESKTAGFCMKHRDRSKELYCFDCNVAMCFMCFAEEHRTHQFRHLNEVVDEFRKQMMNDAERMNETINKCRDVVKEQEKKKVDVNSSIERIEKEICERAELLQKIIDSEKMKLLQELASHRGYSIKQIQHVIEDVEQRELFAGSLINYIEELIGKGTANDIALQARTLCARAVELMKFDDVQRDVNDLDSVKVLFEAVRQPIGCLIGNISLHHRISGNPFDLYLLQHIFIFVEEKIDFICVSVKFYLHLISVVASN
jgi:archaellum component FlaC